MLLEEQKPGSDRYRVVRNAIIVNLILLENYKILTVVDEFKLSVRTIKRILKEH
jgi:hypothetical protein